MTPRMEPDGKIVLINKGTPTDPNIITVDQINSGTDLTPFVEPGSLHITSQEERNTMKEFAAALGVASEAIDGFVDQWEAAAQRILEAPKQELLYRLNSQVRGIDPGLPQNWPGERGLR